MSLLITLPDEVYKHIYSYVFVPKVHLKRWDDDQQKFTNLGINKCAICKRHASTVQLFHVCSFCNPYRNYMNGNKNFCEDTLFCFFCIH